MNEILSKIPGPVWILLGATGLALFAGAFFLPTWWEIGIVILGFAGMIYLSN
jgi:hypothetical protein